jgi:RHS repeat-associated protein
MMRAHGVQRRTFAQRLTACVAVGLIWSGAIAPAALATTATVAPRAAVPIPTAAPPGGTAPLAESPSDATAPRAADQPSLPQLWSPRRVLVGNGPEESGSALFDGNPRTGLSLPAHGTETLRLELGQERAVVGLGVQGAGPLRMAVFVEDPAGRHPVPALGRAPGPLVPGQWGSSSTPSPVRAATLVLEVAAGDAPARLAEIALWALAPAREVADEAALADRLVVGTPANATRADATPDQAEVARVGAQGPQTATFRLKVDRDPALLGRVFVVYELERLAQWTGPSRAINGHPLRGGYRAVRGLGGVQVEEVAPAWLRRGDNTITFQPAAGEDGLGYRVRHLRLVGIPRGAPEPTRTAGPRPIEDGTAGRRGARPRPVSFPLPTGGQPAYLAFQLDSPADGTVALTARSADSHRRVEVQVDLAGRAGGWQSVPLGETLPPGASVKLTVRPGRESQPRVSGARLLSYPVLSPDDITISYPLHGECFDHQAYLRGFVGGEGREAALAIDGQVRTGALAADGSFAVVVPAPSGHKPWMVELAVTSADGARRTRRVSLDACLEPPAPRIVGASPPVEDIGAPYGAVVSRLEARTLSFAGATLEIPAGAVERDVRVTMRPLGHDKLPPLGRLMTNVTPGGGLFRFGPHGLVFRKPVKVTLPIDPALIPPGMNQADLKTFYYDEAHGRWVSLGPAKAGRERVLAMTGHFTDFINATLATPDHPGTQLFDRNAISNIKVGDPSAGITMIEPPHAEASGAARVGYHIETPPGRNGVQPALSLSYDSERVATNGWLGVGWELALPSIEIDTRFGAPKYDGSETYTLEGTMLAPLGNNLYRRRVEARFDRIERKGTGPTDYHWEVTEKNGTVHVYGASAGARLSDPRGDHQPGNIFRWYLETVRDSFGNTMNVSYVHDPFTNGDDFDQVYLQQIDYTANGSLPAAYHVQFVLDDGGTRPDVIVSGRPGFPVATRRRLAEIKVLFGTATVRAYEFEYDPDPSHTFSKSVLSAVALRSNPADPATELYRHTFEYFTAPAADAMFAPPTVWGQFKQPDGSPRADDGLSHATDQLVGGSGSVGVGLFDFLSATVSAGGDTGESSPNLSFFDGNGDGLPDQMDRAAAASLNALLGVAPTAHFGEIQFPGLSTVGHTNRSGWTVGGSLSALEGLFGVGASYAQHTAEDNQVVTDMNGDGFPDLVSLDSGVVTVRINTGHRQFAAPQPWSAFSLGGTTFSRQDRWGQAGQAGAFFPADPLIRWTAPFAGTVTVDTTLMKARTGGDGVRADLFFDGESSPRWTCAFGPADTGPCQNSLALTVAAGDRLYTKVDSLNDPSFDDLTASINVTYQVDSTKALQVEPYGAPIYHFDQAADFRLAGLPSVPWTATAEGDVQATPCFSKTATPDDITASVVHRRGTSVVETFSLAKTASATGSFCLPDLQQPVHVLADDTLTFQVTSDSQIDPNSVGWPITLSYQSYCRIDPNTRASVCGAPVCVAGLCTIGANDPLRDFPLPEGFVHATADVFYPAFQWRSATPAATRTFVTTGAGTPEITWDVSTLGPRIIVYVQGVNRLIAKAVLDAGTPAAHIDVSPSVASGEQLFFTAFFPDGQPFPLLTSVGTPQVDGVDAQANLRFPDTALDNNGPLMQARDPMSGGYHRWFYGDWNGSRTFDESQIQLSATPKVTDTFLFVTPAPFGLPARLSDLGPIPMWLGRGAGELMAAGRIVPGFSSSGATTGSGAGVNALRISDTWNLDLQATAVGLNAAVNAGDATTDIDLFDLNGDRYPDSVSAGTVQYNDGQGAFSARTPIDMGFGDLRSTNNASLRFGVDLGAIGQLINLSNSRSETSKTVSTSVASASTDYGVSSTRTDFVDVNGDGLPDHVRRAPDDAGLRVRLNLGYGFSKEVLWSGPSWQRGTIPASFLTFGSGNIGSDLITDALSVVPGDPTSTNAVRLSDSQTNNLSVGIPGETFGAGGGPNASLTRKIVDFVDVNGDGLPDQLMRAPDEPKTRFRVKLNLGDHFGPETLLTIPDWTVDNSLPAVQLLASPDGIGYSTMAGWAASVHFQFCFIVCVGGSGFYSRDNGGSNMEFEDVDGDGKPDQVLKIANDPNLYVKLNQTGKTNLLHVIHRPLGGTITLDYQRAGNRVDLDSSQKVDMPSNQWAFASVLVESGQPQSQPQPLLEEVDYSSGQPGFAAGFYDRTEREAYGYADVTTRFTNEGTSIATHYENQDYYRKGLETATVWNQAESPAVQTLKRETYSYADPSGADPLAQPPRTGVLFPAPRDTDTFWIEADTGGRSKHHRETKSYDVDGNLTDMVDVGDVDFADPNDDFNYHVDYIHPDPAGLITKPSAITARTGQTQAGALLRRRSATYLAAGAPLTVTDTIAGGKDPATGTARTEDAPALATWTFTYDAFGNVSTAVGPEAHSFSYNYDPTTQSYRTRVTDLSLGYTSTADYDLRFGQPQVLVDVDGAREETDYDDFGRMVRVFGPKDFDGNGARTTPSLRFEYSEQPHTAAGFVEALPASSTTFHKNVAPPEMSRPGDPIAARAAIRTVTFSDGLLRAIQTKKDMTHDDGGTTADGMTVSGAVVFDSRGRLFQQGQPVFRTASQTFEPNVPMLNATTFAYDLLSRERQVTHPDASSVDAAAHGNVAVTTTSYQLGTLDGKLYLLKLVQDPRGEIRSMFRSVREETVGVDEVNKIGTDDNVHLVTRYTYDALSQLLTITDAKENVTSADYDTVGKMVALTSPDAGRTEWRYDRAGNAAVKETANLRATGKLINYVYSADRLEGIVYPTAPSVTLVYGGASETGATHGFVAGRVKRRQDEAGQVDFLYDALGDVVQETSTFVNQRQPDKPYVNTMTYDYDSFGRLLEMRFPGPAAELVRYGYDAGGAVTSARGVNGIGQGNKPPLETVYLKHVGYDEFGQRSRLVLGNDIATGYQYEPDTRRLSQVNTDYRDPVQVALQIGPLPMQRLRYAYDLVGNARTVANDVPSQTNGASVVVGPTSFTFDYDRLYQLTHVDGTYQDHVTTRLRHSLDLAYDEIGNIQQKNQQDFQDTGAVGGTFQPGPARPQTTYALTYQYGGSAPHAVSHIDELRQGNVSTPRDVSHDGDGNQAGWTFQNGSTRTQTWTEEDRLRDVQDQGHVVGHYLYNAEGTRTHSLVDGKETIYLNQYVSIRNGMLYTQHIYAGDTRIATKVNADSLTSADTLWYHPDHLQSVQFVSTSNQTLVQHFEYFASGETWTEESTDASEGSRPAYAFNGKQLDPDTGYYYYGARYYDPQVQNWQSADPILHQYMHGNPMGGVLNPRNLGLYTYAWNNPVVLSDGRGERVQFAGTVSAADRRTILGHLQRLTDDRLAIRGDRVVIVRRGAGAHPLGSQLVSRVIRSARTATIDVAAAGAGNSEDDVTPANAINRRGSDTNIHVDLTANPHIHTLNPRTGRVSDRTRPPQIGTGHELIHADRSMRGRAIDYSTAGTFRYRDAAGNLVTQNRPREELGTVGLRYNRRGDITENQLRHEQHVRPRGAY